MYACRTVCMKYFARIENQYLTLLIIAKHVLITNIYTHINVIYLQSIQSEEEEEGLFSGLSIMFYLSRTSFQFTWPLFDPTLHPCVLLPKGVVCMTFLLVSLGIFNSLLIY